jgi:O-antigen ligase
MAIFTYFLILGIYEIRSIVHTRKYLRAMKYLMLITFSLSIFNLSRFGSSRLNTLTKDILNFNFENIFLNRKEVYSISITAIKEKPFVGYGLAGSQKKLNELYKINNFQHLLFHQYHAHNQYLQFCLYGGVFLGLFLILAILFPLFLNFNLFNLSIVLSFSLPFLSDSPLTDYRVLVIFIFTLTFLYMDEYNKRRLNENF